MRKYGKDGRLDCVICNRCGKKLAVKHGIVREGVFTSDHFEKSDGMWRKNRSADKIR